MGMNGRVHKLKLRSTAAAVGPSDNELIARVLGGEGAAFEKLMRRYNQRIFRAARSILRVRAGSQGLSDHGHGHGSR